MGIKVYEIDTVPALARAADMLANETDNTTDTQDHFRHRGVPAKIIKEKGYGWGGQIILEEVVGTAPCRRDLETVSSE